MINTDLVDIGDQRCAGMGMKIGGKITWGLVCQTRNVFQTKGFGEMLPDVFLYAKDIRRDPCFPGAITKVQLERRCETLLNPRQQRRLRHLFAQLAQRRAFSLTGCLPDKRRCYLRR